jgi:N-acetylmuramoyl-L-alanine amidase
VALVTVARPKDVDLAVPPLTPGQPSGLTLRQIADGYSQWVTRDWTCAVNVEYRAGPSGPSVSLIAEDGKIWATGDPRWPVMLATKDGIVIKDSPVEAEVKAARWAFSAGPWLVRSGKVADIAAEINRCGFSGLMEGTPRERAGIGIRQDGIIVHYAIMSATLHQVASKMLELGCHTAINLDGGGSVGVVDPSGKLLLGYASRQVCCALMFRRILDESPPQDSQPPQSQPKGGEKMIVCIDPGHGGRDRANRGPTGYVEADGALDMALTAGMVLRSHGYKVVFTRDSDRDLAGKTYTSSGDLGGRVALANNAKVEVFVSIHTNAGGGHGTETYHYPGSAKGKRLAERVQRAVVGELGLTSRGVKESSFYVLKATAMPACLVEVAFHDNVLEEQLLKEPAFRARAGFAIASGIMDYFKEV